MYELFNRRQKGLLVIFRKKSFNFASTIRIYVVIKVPFRGFRGQNTMFNKETEYALRSLVYIQYQNNRQQTPGIEEISKEIEAPQAYVAKILQRMVRLGFVNSIKGKGGGFLFDELKSELTLKELILATEGGTILNGCGFGMKHCNSDNPCPLHDQYGPIRDAINKLVSEETIQSLARKENAAFKVIIP